MEIGDVVGDLLQVPGDVAGQEDGVLLVGDEGEQLLQNVVPDHRVQSGGGLVQNEQPGPVGQGGGQGQLHLHAPGQLLHRLFPRQLEFVQIVPEQPIVPGGKHGGEDGGDVFETEAVVEKAVVQHHAHLRLGLTGLAPGVAAQQGDGPPVPADRPQ